ncbi:MAG: helix-turn-helix domain-containing protein [Patescibacteria group bacterium]
MKKKYAGEHYTHIKKIERLEIAILLNKGYGIRDIANGLKRSLGTISEEISKNSVKGLYCPCKANHKAYVKRKYSKYQGMKIEKNIELRNYVEQNIKQDWSPEQIAGRLKEIDTYIKYASYGAVYKFIHSEACCESNIEKLVLSKSFSKKGLL